MTVQASDTYNRSNQSNWGTASDGTNTWSVLRGTSAFSISSNKGAVANNSGAYCVARCGTGTSDTTDQTTTFTRANTADVAGLVARVTDANNWYSCNVGEFTNNLVISKFVAGSYSDLAFGANATYATGTTWAIRFKVSGTTLQGKIWDASGSEPGPWTVTTTDSSLSGAHGYGIIADPFTGTAMNFLSYSATDGVTSTQVTQSTPVRLLVRTQQTKSAVLRALVRTQHIVSSSLRTVVRSTKVISSPVRAIVRTAHTVSAPLLIGMRTTAQQSIPLRALVRTGRTLSSVLRTTVGTLNRVSAPVRTAVRTNKLVSTALRSVVRTLATISLPIRTCISSQQIRSTTLRIVSSLNQQNVSTVIRCVISQTVPDTNAALYARKGIASFFVKEGTAAIRMRKGTGSIIVRND